MVDLGGWFDEHYFIAGEQGQKNRSKTESPET